MKHILITGINGYIARHLAEAISSHIDTIVGSVRKIHSKPNNLKITLFEAGDLADSVDWTDALKGVDTVFHLAGTVHTAHEPKVYNQAIVHGTKNLVEQSIDAGVMHFIYVSSAAVYGKEHFQHVLSETDTPTPNTPYGEAKLAAENEVIHSCENTNMAYTIVRPPIVYGHNAPGNVAKLKKLAQKFPVLPFGSATKKRSMVSIDNLVDFLITCATSEQSHHQIFNITDNADKSTSDLCKTFASELDKKILLLPIPKPIMRALLTMVGQKPMYDKLFGQLRFSVDHAIECLNWQPSLNRDTTSN